MSKYYPIESAVKRFMVFGVATDMARMEWLATTDDRDDAMQIILDFAAVDDLAHLDFNKFAIWEVDWFSVELNPA